MKTKSRPARKIKFANLAAVPKTYRALCDLWLPRPIRNAAAAAEAGALIDALAVFPNLNEEQLDYLDAVSHFVTEHDGEIVWPAFSGLELLKSLVDDHCLSGADLSRILGGSRLLGPMILRGERNITADHARILGAHFKLSPGAFL